MKVRAVHCNGQVLIQTPRASGKWCHARIVKTYYDKPGWRKAYQRWCKNQGHTSVSEITRNKPSKAKC